MATIAGATALIINDSIRPLVSMPLTWGELENRNWQSFDRGADQDVYEGTFSVRGTRTQIENLVTALEGANRTQISITLGAGESIFGPDISATLATVLEYAEHKRESFGRYSQMDIKMMALNPVASGTPNFTTLKLLRTQYSSTTDWSLQKHVAMNPANVTYTDRRADQGSFKATFRATEAEYIGIRRYIVETARGGVITFPDIQGITYPWGPRGPEAGGNCRIRYFGNERKEALRWIFDLHFSRER